jgi:hypothetical protein
MGGSSTTTVQQAPPSAEEKAYLTSQQELAAKQLEILNSQQDFNKSYMDEIKPVLDQQTQLLQQQLSAQLDPTAQKQALDIANAQNTNTQKSLDLQQRQLDAQLAGSDSAQKVQDLQTQLLTKQLDALNNGNAPTPEQLQAINDATGAAFDKGKQQVDQYSSDALDQLRQNLSPTLGLRPTDTPITDRGGLIAREGVRQVGQLSSSLAEANANARLNYPLAVQQLNDSSSQFQQNLQQAQAQFQAGLSDAAAQNRLRLLGASGDAINSGTQTGIGLVTGSRGNPLSFTRGSTSTTDKSFGIGDIFSGLGAVGGLASGLGAVGLKISDGRTKYDIRTEGHDDAGHRWVRFKYKGDPNKTDFVGVIAQEAEKISPEAVLTDGTGLKMVNYKRLRRAA